MKKILCLLLCLLTIQVFAKNTITYIKMERTACFGKCPTYSVEFLKSGQVIYTGKNNVKMMGTYRAWMTKTQMRNFYRQYEKYRYANLASKYAVLSTDVPGMNITVTVNGKVRTVKHAEAGPRFLTQIGADVDEKVAELKWKGDPGNEPEVIRPVEGDAVESYIEPEVLDFAEQMPYYPGGDAAMKNYLAQNLKYPELAKENGIQGKVFCKFLVDVEGRVSNVQVQRGIGYGCDDEAVRVIQAMPRWIPGMQNGRKVNVSFVLPVFFKLQ